MTKRLVSLKKIIINTKWNKKNKYLNFFLNLISSNLIKNYFYKKINEKKYIY